MNTTELSKPNQFLYNLFAKEFCHPTAYYGNVIGRINNHISEIFINFLNNKQNKEFYIKTIEDSKFNNLSDKFKKNAINCINKCFNVFIFKETIDEKLHDSININIIATKYYQYLEHKDLDLFRKKIFDANMNDSLLFNQSLDFIIEKHSKQAPNQQNSSSNQPLPNQSTNPLINQQNSSSNQSLPNQSTNPLTNQQNSSSNQSLPNQSTNPLTNQQNSSSNQSLPNQLVGSLLVGLELNSDTVYQPLDINTLSNSSIQEIVPQPYNFPSNSTSTAQHFAFEDVINSMQRQTEDRFSEYSENNDRFADEEQVAYPQNNERFANEEVFQSTTQLNGQGVNSSSNQSLPNQHVLSNSTSTAQHFDLKGVINGAQWQTGNRFSEYPENDHFADEEDEEVVTYPENNERFANEDFFQSTTQLNGQGVNSSSKQSLTNQVINRLANRKIINRLANRKNSSSKQSLPNQHVLSNSTSTAQHFGLKGVINGMQWKIEDRFANEEKFEYSENNERFANEEQITYPQNNERFANEEFFQSTTQPDGQGVNGKNSG